jgi:para-aminobenzoate synthetase
MSPLDTFAEAVRAHPRCVWLDGGGAREWSGRRSLVGWLEDDDVSLTYSAARREVTRHRGGASEVVGDDVFTVLTEELAAGEPSDQWFGYLGYAARPDLPAAVAAPDDPHAVPDAVWMRPSHLRLFEHDPVEATEGRWSSGASAGERTSSPPRPPADYAHAFERVQEALHAGDSYEVNLTYRVHTEVGLDPVSAYLRLRGLNPAPYAGFLQHDVGDVPGARSWLLSSSPERYALVTRTDDGGRGLETRPIKGTTPRGATPAEDEEQRHRLATDAKFRSENLMIVDLLRNDLAMVCEPGSVTVPELMAVESYPSVHQLVSTVRGRLRAEVSTVEALRALFPAGSMTGAPKLRTMEVIEAVESSPRAVYSGAFGWLSADGRADLGVVIRSLFTAGGGRWTLGTGGGITVHSDLAEEYAESRWKAERLLAALADGPAVQQAGEPAGEPAGE